MNRKLTLCLLLTLFFNTSLATTEEEIACEETVTASKNDLSEPEISKDQQTKERDHTLEMLFFSIYNLVCIKRSCHLAMLYLQKDNGANKFALKAAKELFRDDLPRLLLSISQMALALEMQAEGPKKRGLLHKFWLSTALLSDGARMSLHAYRFYKWLLPSAAKIAARKARALAVREKLIELITESATSCLQDNNPELVKRCNKVFTSYSRLLGPEALTRLKESIS